MHDEKLEWEGWRDTDLGAEHAEIALARRIDRLV
jgi:hypothetical protein